MIQWIFKGILQIIKWTLIIIIWMGIAAMFSVLAFVFLFFLAAALYFVSLILFPLIFDLLKYPYILYLDGDDNYVYYALIIYGPATVGVIFSCHCYKNS